MGTLSFPFNLAAGDPENVNQLNSNLAAIQTVLNGQVDSTNLADLAATTAKINDLAVTTGKLADDAVTSDKVDLTCGAVAPSANTTLDAGGAWTDLTGATTTVVTTTESNLLVVATAYGGPNASTAGPETINFRVVVNGNVMDGAQGGIIVFGWTGSAVSNGGSFCGASLALAAGSYTIKMQGKRAAGGDSRLIYYPGTAAGTGFIYLFV